MKNCIFLIVMCSFLIGCQQDQGYPTYEFAIDKENVDKAAEFIAKTCEAANPKSDEEGEDLVARVEETAMKLYGTRMIGMRDRRGKFTPYDQLSDYDKKRCDVFKKTGEY